MILKDLITLNLKKPNAPNVVNSWMIWDFDFEAPKKSDIKAWRYIQQLYSVGITFHSCGCSSPGYVPNDKESLISYYNIQERYEKQLSYWKSRIEPQTIQEVNREISKHSHEIFSIPREKRLKKGTINNADTIKYWLDCISEVDAKLALIKA